jgi:hypothetical protein
MRTNPIVSLLIAVCGLLIGAMKPATDAAWSEPVNGLRARIEARPWSRSNGTLIVAPFLDLQNVSDLGGGLQLGWKRAKMSYSVVDADGKPLEQHYGVYDGIEADKSNLVIPHDGELSFNLSQSGAGIPADQAAMIDLGSDDTWQIPHDGKRYFLRASLQVDPDPADREAGTWDWHGKISLPDAEIPEHAPQPTPTSAAAVIDELGKQMLANRGPISSRATRQLSLIDDPRVVDWYLKAAKSRDYELKSAAIDRLCEFPGDSALEGLRIGMHTTAADLDGGSVDLSENIRDEAAEALARSSNPNALNLLFSMANDGCEGVRITVIQQAARANTPASRALLERMASDRDETVRDEALRELHSLHPINPQTQPVQ